MSAQGTTDEDSEFVTLAKIRFDVSAEELREAAARTRAMPDERSNTTDPRQVLLAVAAMHDRAARRARRRDGVRRLVHEEAALHLRAISDEPEAIAALIAGIDKTELTAGDPP